MGVTAIIPARLGSTRFPRKVLADETGRPLVVHAAQAATRAGVIDRVVVAADDDEILDAVRRFGIEGVLTDPSHENGTSRLAEAARLLGLRDDDVVVNVQGDEPEMEPDHIAAAVERLVGGDSPVATTATPISPGDAIDPNVVKVVTDVAGRALYFSRSLIPHDRDGGARGHAPAPPLLRHLGLYAYRAAFLATYTSLAPTPLERAERLEQLRLLEHGHSIGVAVVDRPGPPGIDTPEQYEAFVERYRLGSGAL